MCFQLKWMIISCFYTVENFEVKIVRTLSAFITDSKLHPTPIYHCESPPLLLPIHKCRDLVPPAWGGDSQGSPDPRADQPGHSEGPHRAHVPPKAHHGHAQVGRHPRTQDINTSACLSICLDLLQTFCSAIFTLHLWHVL